jgi:hypothetical protein
MDAPVAVGLERSPRKFNDTVGSVNDGTTEI